MQADANQLTTEVLQQNPLLAFYMTFVFAVILVAAGGFFASWAFVFYRRNNGKPILPMTLPWEPRRWSFVEVFFIAVGWITLNMIMANVAALMLGVTKASSATLELAGAASIGSLITVVLGTLWICVRYNTNAEHVGFGPIRGKTLAVGLIGGLTVIPLMYIVMGVVSSLSQSKYEHPLIDSAVESATFPKYLMAVFAAAIVAPIVEEFLFRVVLQGWLQSIPFRSLAETIVGGEASSSPKYAATAFDGASARIATPNMSTQSMATPTMATPANVTLNDYSGPIANDTVRVQAEPTSPAATTEPTIPSEMLPTISGIYQPSATLNTVENTPEVPVPENAIRPPFWPSIIAGVLFGVMHYGYGVSFIPLSFLGIFLGWIYRQTHSIWPCILIHMMLNSFSMMMLGLVILMKQAGIEVQ